MLYSLLDANYSVLYWIGLELQYVYSGMDFVQRKYYSVGGYYVKLAYLPLRSLNGRCVTEVGCLLGDELRALW